MTTNETLDPVPFGPTTPPMNERAAAEFFAVLSSPIRLSVLQVLVGGERCVTELVDTLRIAQPRLSNHLACLRNCGFVQVRRRGTFLHYSLADPRLADIVRLGASLAQPSADALLRCPVLGEECEA